MGMRLAAACEGWRRRIEGFGELGIVDRKFD